MTIYRLLLRLFPRDGRESFGAEMEELFERQRASCRGRARARFWLRAIADAIRNGLGERFDRMKIRRPRRTRWRMETLRPTCDTPGACWFGNPE